MNNKILISWRVIFILMYFYYSLNIYSLASLIFCYISIFLWNPSPRSIDIKSKIINLTKINFKKILSKSDIEIKDKLNFEYLSNLEKLTTYDAANSESLANFQKIQLHSNCLFAKKARLWGSCPYKLNLSLEANICRWVPTFCKFCYERQLDGFVFELPASIYALSLKQLTNSVNRTLKFLTYIDKQSKNPFHKLSSDFIKELTSNEIWTQEVNKKRWVFSFCHQTFFISTFSPIYPENHPRFTYGCNCVFIFFQPEISFALHNLSIDHQSNLLNQKLKKKLLPNLNRDIDSVDQKHDINLSSDQHNGNLLDNQYINNLQPDQYLNNFLLDEQHGNDPQTKNFLSPYQQIVNNQLTDQQSQNTFIHSDNGLIRDNALSFNENVNEKFNDIRFKIREKFKLNGQEYIIYNRMVYSAVLPLDPIRHIPVDFTQY